MHPNILTDQESTLPDLLAISRKAMNTTRHIFWFTKAFITRSVESAEKKRRNKFKHEWRG